MQDKIQVGSVVISNAGRDAGKTFLVVGVTEGGDYALIVDGRIRKLDKPKKKKMKHLKTTDGRLATIAVKLLESKQVFDKEISSALRNIDKE